MPRPDRPPTAAEARAAAEAQRAERAAALRAELDAVYPDGPPGRAVVVASWVGTGIQTVASVLAVVDPDDFLALFVGVALCMLVVGSILFVVAMIVAAGRSREKAIGIGGLFFLVGSAPPSVARSLNASLAASTVVALVAIGARFSTPELAFGVVAPMYALGCSGLWGARHGHYAPRRPAGDRG
jgi:hypothetical protein